MTKLNLFFKIILYFIVGLSCILPLTLAIIFLLNIFYNITFLHLLILSFLFILAFFGIVYLIEGIRKIVAFRYGKKNNSFLFTNLISIFLIIILIGSYIFYISYIDIKKQNIGPYLSWTDEDTSSTMTITWETNYSEPNPILKWGATSHNVNRLAKVQGDNHHHTVKLKGLKPDSTYYYKIPGIQDDIIEFKTGPEIGSHSPFSFLFYGDSREDDSNLLEPDHEENIELMLKERHARFILQAGDIANNMAKNWREQWIYNFQLIKPISEHLPYMTVEGNHDEWHQDKNSGKLKAYFEYFELPHNDPNEDESSYWFYYGNVFILVLGYHEEEYAAPEDYDSEFVNWVVENLQYAKNSGLFDWIFVMNHIPAFSIKIEDNILKENNTQIRYWHPIFMENGVDFVLNGHNHHYERVTVGYTPEDIGSHNITYLVSGGGGGGSKLHGCKMATYDSNTDPVGDLKYFGQTDYFNVSYHYVKFSVNGPRLTLTATTDRKALLETHTFSK